MKQLVVTGSFPYYNHTFVNHQVASTIAAGHDVQILSPSTGDALGETEAARLGISLERCIYLDAQKCPLFTPSVKRFSSAIRAAAKSNYYGRQLAERRKSFFCNLIKQERLLNLDIIHAHFSGWAYEVAIPLGKLLGVPVTVTIHNVELPYMRADYLREIHENVARVVLVSEEWKKIWTEKTGFTDKLSVIPNGVDLMVPPVPVAGGRIKIITVSRLVPNKRIQDGLMAVRQLIDQGIDCEYEIIGSGGEESDLKKLSTQLEIDDRVIFHGILPNSKVKERMSNANILLHPSESESFGIAVIEGMSASMPVVAGNSKPVMEIVEHGISGFLYPPGNINQMVGYLADLCKSSEKRAAFGKEGYQAVRLKYSWDIHMAQMISLWNGVIAARSAR